MLNNSHSTNDKLDIPKEEKKQDEITSLNDTNTTTTQESADDGWSEIPTKTNRRRKPKPLIPTEPPQPEYSYLPSTKEFHDRHANFQPYILLLVGIPGSGKSTFSKALSTARPYKYIHTNQDKLGKRQACIDKTRQTLYKNINNDHTKLIPIIDRCNIDTSQRDYFISIANEFQIPIDCVVFMQPIDTCVKRCRARKNHESVGKENAEKVVNCMAKQFVAPWVKKEGFRSVKVLNRVDMVNDVILEYINE